MARRRSERSRTKTLKAELEEEVKSKISILRQQKKRGAEEKAEVEGGREDRGEKEEEETEEEGTDEEWEEEDKLYVTTPSRTGRRKAHSSRKRRRERCADGEDSELLSNSHVRTLHSKWKAEETADAAAGPSPLVPPSPSPRKRKRRKEEEEGEGKERSVGVELQAGRGSREERGREHRCEGKEAQSEGGRGGGGEGGDGEGRGVGGVGGGVNGKIGGVNGGNKRGEGRREGGESEVEEELDMGPAASLRSTGCWKHYPSLCSSLPGREREIDLLLTIFGEPSTAPSPPLYIYGHSGTGKTVTLRTILTTLELPHAFVSCVECYSPRLLFETILDQLLGAPAALVSGRRQCSSMVQFVQSVQDVLDRQGYRDSTVYIVLDKAERLRDMETTLLPAFLRLPELTHCKLCTVLVSELVWEKYPSDTGAVQPYPIHFPQYNKAEVLAIMCRDCPPSEPISFFKTFANHIWNVFQSVCRDLAELRYLSSLLYPKYCEPVESGEVGRQETRRLWRHIEPYFRGIMSKIYLREISSAQWERAQSKASDNDAASVASVVKGLSQSQTSLELPYFSKYLLIAAYLASYNPSKSDRKFFSQQKQSRSRKGKKPQQKEKPNYQLLGPKPFPLDRMMAIFYSILEEPVTPTADIYSQISSLVTLQLICQLPTKDPLDAPKYKCLVTIELVQHVARTVGFELVQYLYDFN